MTKYNSNVSPVLVGTIRAYEDLFLPFHQFLETNYCIQIFCIDQIATIFSGFGTGPLNITLVELGNGECIVVMDNWTNSDFNIYYSHNEFVCVLSENR